MPVAAGAVVVAAVSRQWRATAVAGPRPSLVMEVHQVQQHSVGHRAALQTLPLRLWLPLRSAVRPPCSRIAKTCTAQRQLQLRRAQQLLHMQPLLQVLQLARCLCIYSWGWTQQTRLQPWRVSDGVAMLRMAPACHPGPSCQPGRGQQFHWCGGCCPCSSSPSAGKPCKLIFCAVCSFMPFNLSCVAMQDL